MAKILDYGCLHAMTRKKCEVSSSYCYCFHLISSHLLCLVLHTARLYSHSFLRLLLMFTSPWCYYTALTKLKIYVAWYHFWCYFQNLHNYACFTSKFPFHFSPFLLVHLLLWNFQNKHIKWNKKKLSAMP